MKKIIGGLLVLVGFFCFFNQAYAVYVHGYYRSNGTYVNGYERTSPDGNPYSNYGFPGNYNPNTGTITGGNASTYLDNYYKSSSYSSSYYSPSYTNYSYSYSNPTCPLNSYYDGISSCKCNSGYVVQNGSCVSGESYCDSQHGYMSTYNSLSKTCGCMAGYFFNNSGQCVSGDDICYSQTGYNSKYDSLTNTCKCNDGYTIDSSGLCSLTQPTITPKILTNSKSMSVVYKKSSCDYFIVSDSSGSYDLLEWYSGYDPEIGDTLYGNVHTYGFHDLYIFTHSKTHVWIEDWLLTWSNAITQYDRHCR